MTELEAIDLSLLQGTSIYGHASSLLKQYNLLLHRHFAHNDFLLHPTNCLCLATSYSRCLHLVFHNIKSSVGSCSTAGSSSASLDKLCVPLSALHCSIQEGIQFLGDCTGPHPISEVRQWLIDKAVLLAFTTDIFDRHLHDLVWCMSVLMRIFDSLHADDHVSDEAPLREMLMQTWINGKVEQDVKSFQMFLSKLMSTTPQGQEGQDICELAKFISRRLSLCRADESCEPVDNSVLQENLMVGSEGFDRREQDSIGNGSFAGAFVVKWMGGRFASKEFFHVEDEKTFLREAAIQARLCHPNVVPLVCCTKSTSRSNKCSLVMELMQQDLRSLILSRTQDGSARLYQDKPFSLLVAVDLMLQIAMGMEYLHSLHIAHRDLKSDNILVSYTSSASLNLCSELDHVRVKIADFGMSKTKLTSKSLFTSKDVGATAWRAPEAFGIDSDNEGSKVATKYTYKADVYSFAMVCYEILTGKLPIDHFGKLTGLRDRLIKGERPNLPRSCPLALSNYIKRCWHGTAMERPAFKEICTVLRYFKSCIACGDLQSLAWPRYLPNAHQSEKNSYRHVQILDMVFQMWTVGKHHGELQEPMATLPDPYNPSEAYIFAGKYYIKIKINDDGSDELITSPRIIEEYWPALKAANFSTVDATYPCPEWVGKTYIFCKDKCVKIMLDPNNTLNSRLLQGPIPIWPELRSVSFNRLDAAFVLPGNKKEVYCFKGGVCVVMYLSSLRGGPPLRKRVSFIDIKRGPSDITQAWPSLKEAGFSTVDAVLPKANGQVYFFSKSHYAVIEVKRYSFIQSVKACWFCSSRLHADRIVQMPSPVTKGWRSLRELANI